MKIGTHTTAAGMQGKLYVFDGGTRIVEFNGWLEITLPDGRTFNSVPEDNSEYRSRARSLGYVKPTGEIDTWAMCREHDILHARTAELFGLSCSPSLDRTEHRTPTEITDAEEQLILAWQRYRNVLKREGII